MKAALVSSLHRGLCISLAVVSLVSVLACGGGGGGDLLGLPYSVSAVNLTQFSTATLSAGSDTLGTNVPYGAFTCFTTANAVSDHLAPFTWHSGTTTFTESAPGAMSLGDGPFFYLAYGNDVSPEMEVINISGGSGSGHDVWVTDLSQINTANFQVTIHDATTNSDNIVTPVSAAAATSRTRFEIGLTAGHNYTVFLTSGATTFSAPFTLGTGAEGNVVIALVDKPGTSTQELKVFRLNEDTCM